MSEAIHRGEAIADLAGPPVVQRVHVALRKGRIAEDFNRPRRAEVWHS